MARKKRENKELAVRIGQVMLNCRKAADMTQEALAELLDLQPETISRLEHGRLTPSVEKLVEIAEVFRIPVATFFEHLDNCEPDAKSNLIAQKISMAIDKLPDTGKTFVLKVAEDYARYHLTPPKGERKSK
jgi:transcriptional regulator with XRE-family HTH domain